MGGIKESILLFTCLSYGSVLPVGYACNFFSFLPEKKVSIYEGGECLGMAEKRSGLPPLIYRQHPNIETLDSQQSYWFSYSFFSFLLKTTIENTKTLKEMETQMKTIPWMLETQETIKTKAHEHPGRCHSRSQG